MDWFGELSGILVNPRTASLEYAVIAAGEQWDFASDRILVPWDVLELAPEEGVLAIKGRLDPATVLEYEPEPGILYPFSRLERETQTPAYVAGIPENPPGFIRISELLFKEVIDSRGENIGEIRALLIDPVNETVALALVESAAVTGLRTPIHLPAMNFTGPEQMIILPYAEEALAQVPPVASAEHRFTIEETWEIYFLFDLEYPE
ncbi:MAG: PRC-barrel domain-containing protein, partial [Desulfovibrionales bacterium]